MKTVKTKKGTELPLTNLKGKDYLMVAYRLQWLTEEIERYMIDTVVQHRTEDMASVQATITIADANGNIVRRVTARKTEAAKHFADFEEKAETGAIGRALAMLGFGTQHALSDLDEGDRIADAPVVSGFKSPVQQLVSLPKEELVEIAKNEELTVAPKKSSFRKKSNGAEKTEVLPKLMEKEDEGW